MTAMTGSHIRYRVGTPAGMLLGVDFLKAHRVLVAHSQRKIYFTYVGGPVFERVNSQQASVFLNRGKALYTKKDYDKALEAYDAALHINPQLADAFVARGMVWYERKDYDRAVADFARAIEIDPRLARAYLFRGYAEQLTGNIDAAIADYSQAIAVDPTLAAAHNKLAWELATSARAPVRDGQRAVELALKACELSHWNNPNYVDTLAAAYARAGNFEEAVRWQRKAMESLADNDNATPRLRLYEKGKAWPPD